MLKSRISLFIKRHHKENEKMGTEECICNSHKQQMVKIQNTITNKQEKDIQEEHEQDTKHKRRNPSY